MTASASARFMVPPPTGTDCECEVACACTDFDACQHEPDHWHQRFMGAVCDTCGEATIEADVFAYTRADAFGAIASHAAEAGWKVVGGSYYTCPGCRV